MELYKIYHTEPMLCFINSKQICKKKALILLRLILITHLLTQPRMINSQIAYYFQMGSTDAQ
jgi:hypothetical protein